MATKRKGPGRPALGEVKVLVAVDAATKREIERAAKREDISVREWWRRAAAARLSGRPAALDTP